MSKSGRQRQPRVPHDEPALAPPVLVGGLTDRLDAAVADGRAVLADLHRGVKDYRTTVKEHEAAIADAFRVEVERQVTAIAREVHDRMVASVEAMMVKIEADWRAALGLPPPG